MKMINKLSQKSKFIIIKSFLENKELLKYTKKIIEDKKHTDNKNNNHDWYYHISLPLYC